VFVGEIGDLLAVRRNPPPDQTAERLTRPYWDNVRRVLTGRPPVLILQAAAQRQYGEALANGAMLAGPGVAILRGPASLTETNPIEPLPRVPSLLGGIGWAIAILILLGLAGAGWSQALLARSHHSELVIWLAPPVGAAALSGVGVAVSGAGLALDALVVAIMYAAVVISGLAIGFGRRRTVQAH
jgi:hypothetical protein